MSARNPDGRFRNHNKPIVLSPDMLRSRWVEGEVLRLKRLGFSYEAIAPQITEVGRGQRAPLTPLPEDVTFPPDYTITAMGCHAALKRAQRRAPKSEADEMRRLLRGHVSFPYALATAGRSAGSAGGRAGACA